MKQTKTPIVLTRDYLLIGEKRVDFLGTIWGWELKEPKVCDKEKGYTQVMWVRMDYAHFNNYFVDCDAVKLTGLEARVEKRPGMDGYEGYHYGISIFANDSYQFRIGLDMIIHEFLIN